MAVGNAPLSMTYQNEQWALIPKVDPPPALQPLIVHAVTFSRSAKELLSIVDVTPNEQYTEALNNFFKQKGMTMTRVGFG